MSPKLRSLTLAALILVFSIGPRPSYSQLDPTFGANGVRTIFYGFSQFLNTVTGIRAFRRSDNTIIFLVHNTGTDGKTPPVNGMSVAFLSPNASILTHTSLVSSVIAVEAAMRPDGNLAATGNLAAGDIFIERFNSDGSLAGLTTLSFGNNNDTATNVATQADGKIVVSGASSNANGTVTVVARLNPDGTFDPTFGPYGNGTLDIYDNGVLSRKMTIRPDGKIFLAGIYFDGPETVSMFYLLNSNGSPDSSFGDGGLAFAFDAGQANMTDVKPQPDGKIVTLATQTLPEPGNTASDQKILLRRLNADGSIDTGFGQNGVAVANTSPASLFAPSPFDPNGVESSRELVVESTGNIVAILLADQLLPTASGLPYPRLQRKQRAVCLLRFNTAGVLIGKNVSKKMQFDTAYTLTPLSTSHLRGGFEQPGMGIVVHGSVGTASGPLGLLLRYAAISAPNNANNFFDYNFDGYDEFGTYLPGTSGFSKWRLGRSNTAGSGAREPSVFEFGLAGDTPVPGDYDGDGVLDLAVFRNDTGDWFTRKVYLTGCGPMDCTEQLHFGQPEDVPAPGDFDADGITDRVVFRPSEGNWYILFSSGSYTGLHFGQNGDLPVTGDYDGDGRSDVAVIRRENGQMTWYIQQSSIGNFVGIQFGLDTDKAVPGDYNGDGRTEIAVWRPSDGNWYFLRNYTNFSALNWGIDGDLPAPADYDADRSTDVAIFRPSEGNFYALASHNTSLLAYHHPADATEIPIASAYVR